MPTARRPLWCCTAVDSPPDQTHGTDSPTPEHIRPLRSMPGQLSTVIPGQAGSRISQKFPNLPLLTKGSGYKKRAYLLLLFFRTGALLSSNHECHSTLFIFPQISTFSAIIQVNQCQLAPLVKNCRILLGQSFTARMPLLTATSASGLGRGCWSSPQQC